MKMGNILFRFCKHKGRSREKKVENASEKYNTFSAMPIVLNDIGQVAYSEKSMGRLVKYKNGSPVDMEK